ncbi:hypothetical protein GGI20_006283, partial [Coemansia sp. BCRC 34301]
LQRTELEALRQAAAATESQRNELQSKLAESESAAATAGGKAQEMQQALSLAQRTAQELQARLDENEAMRDEYQQRITTQSQEYEELKGEYEEIKGKYEREGSHALELEQANAEFKAQYDALTAEVEQLKSAHSEAVSRVAELEDAHGMAQEVRARGEVQHKEIQEKLLQEVAAKEAQAEEARRQLLQEVADLGKRLDAETSGREKADQARTSAEAELQRVKLAADSSSRVRDEAEGARREASTRLLQAEADAEALRRAVDDYKALADRHERKAGTQLETINARDLELTQLGRKLQRVERRLEEVMAQAAYHLDARNRLDSENVDLREKLEEAYRTQGDTRGLDSAVVVADSSALIRRVEAQAAERVHAAEESRLALTQALHAAQRE